MDKRNVVYTHSNIHFSLKRKEDSDTCYMLVNFVDIMLKGIRQSQKGIPYDFTYIARVGKVTETKSKMVAAVSQREWKTGQSFNGFRISVLALLWLWRRPVAPAPIRPLAWEPPYAAGAAQRHIKKTKKKKKRKKNFSFKGDKIPEIGCTIMHITLTLLNATLKNGDDGNCMLRILPRFKNFKKGTPVVKTYFFNSLFCSETSLWKYNPFSIITSCYHSQIHRNSFLIVNVASLPAVDPKGDVPT